MKKRLLSLFVVLTMLLAAVSMPVSASTGLISSENPIVFQNQAETMYASNNSISSTTLGGLQQHHLNTVATDTANEDYFGALSFKIKADAANMTQTDNRDTFTFIVQDVDTNSSTKNNENNVFVMDYSGYMRANYSETGWNQAVGTPYNNDQWYTIGIRLGKDGYYDCYIDGVKVSTTKNNKEWSKTTGSFKFLFNISNNGKYYIDELTWSKYSDDSFIAEVNKVKVPNGGSVSVNFSEPVASYDLSKIKVYECETDTLVGGTNAEFADETLTVTMPDNSMTPGKEYRVELNDIKGALGRTLATDNVYFNCELGGSERTDVIGSDDFDDFSATTATLPSPDEDYYQPNGWYLGHKWNSQTGTFVRPVSGDANYATAMQIGLQGSDGGSAHAYMPLNQTADSGIVTISFDLKPERVSNKWNDSWDDARTPNMVFMVYPDGIDASDKTWAQGDSASIGKTAAGRYVAGIFAHTIGASRFPGVGNNADQRISLKELTVDTTDTKKVSDADSKWYNMKIELNFDKGTTTYWLDGVETAGESLATLNIDAIQGISFSAISNSRDNSTLIDNVKVEYTHVANIKTDTVKTENFEGFVASESILKGDDTDYYQPTGWYLAHKWPGQVNAFFRPTTDTDNGTVLQVGKRGSDGSSAHGYLPLDKNINSGIVTINFDMKPERVSTHWNDSWDDARTPNMVVMVYPDGIDDTDKVWANNESVSIGKPTSSDDQTARYIAGIFRHTIGASRFPGVGNNADQRIALKELTVDTTDTKKVSDADSKWYNMKIELNFDEGTTTYWLDDVKTAGESLSTLNIDAIQGISFGCVGNAKDASTLIDNISVTHTYNDNSGAGVMQVRFSDYYGKNYGTATTYTTVLDTIDVAFWAKNIDSASLDASTVKLVNPVTGDEIPYDGEFYSETGVYEMNLREYLTKGTTYTLIVDGVTAGGTAIDKYEQTITSDSEGVVIVEPMYIMHGAENATSGALVNGSTITAGTRLINTTGETKNYAFFMALYADGVLVKSDFAEVEQDGHSTAEDKEANISASFTMSAADATSITNVKAFLWNGMTTMKPVLPAIEFTNTSAVTE